jgi:hypothetical protein
MTNRNPVDVIDAVLMKLPGSFSHVAHLLEKVRSDSTYRPPEAQGETWYAFCHVLNSELPFPPVEEWQKDVYRIVTGKELDPACLDETSTGE